ncbi:MAG: four helix bundle protein [Salinivirgaceae bacterium]
MIATCFEELEIWKRAREIVKNIHLDFSDIKDFEFKNQIYSAGYSIMNNISEGFGRESVKEFIRFLDFSKGSSCEVKNMYYIAEDVKYIDPETAKIRRDACEFEKNSVAKLMNYLKSKS